MTPALFLFFAAPPARPRARPFVDGVRVRVRVCVRLYARLRACGWGVAVRHLSALRPPSPSPPPKYTEIEILPAE